MGVFAVKIARQVPLVKVKAKLFGKQTHQRVHLRANVAGIWSSGALGAMAGVWTGLKSQALAKGGEHMAGQQVLVVSWLPQWLLFVTASDAPSASGAPSASPARMRHILGNTCECIWMYSGEGTLGHTGTQFCCSKHTTVLLLGQLWIGCSFFF